MRAPRVLLSGIVLAQPMGGVIRHNAELLPRVARLLEEAGGELVLLEGSGGLAFDLPERVRRIRSQVPSGGPLRRAPLESRALLGALAEAQAEGRPFDLWHTGHLPAPRSQTPFTLTLHDLRDLELTHTPFSRRLLARSVIGGAVERARLVFTVSSAVKDDIEARWPSACGRVRVIPNGVDHFTPAARRTAPGAHLVHVGHLEARKNLAVALDALASDEQLPDLDLWGAPKGVHAEELRAHAGAAGVEHRVHFRGPFQDDQLPTILADAAAVVLPSRLEGFGIVALEALRARAPLAMARGAALEEVVGQAALLFDPDDVEGCAGAIRAALARTPEELERGARHAEKYTWDSSARVWFEAWVAASS